MSCASHQCGLFLFFQHESVEIIRLLYRAELESGAPSNVPSAAHELDGHVVGLLAFGDLPGQERVEKGQAHAVAGGHGCAACLLKARHVHHRTSLEVTRTDGQTDARIRTSNERT